jgi:hypothetical protein
VSVARPEKALFDIAYVAAARRTAARVPELELPPSFDRAVVDRWLARVSSPQLRTLTHERVEQLLARATR